MPEPHVYTAVIVDDEPAGRDAVAALLDGEPRVNLVARAANGRDAPDVIRRHRPDLLFLDIQMPDRDGFGVIDALGPDVPRAIVFVTAHDEHALRAFDVHALDYVLKPFGRPRFQAAVQRAIRRLEADDAHSLRQTLAALVASARRAATDAMPASTPAADEADPPERFPVHNNGRTTFVAVRDIDWVEAVGDYARLHTSGTAHLVASRMHRIHARLETAGFLRIHRSTIVNLARVAELQRTDDGGAIVVLDDGVQLRVARNRRAPLEAALGLRS
jgi:two-component system, LytTR family, response regulator